MVSNEINSVSAPKIGVESLPDRRSYTYSKSKIVVPGKASNNFPIASAIIPTSEPRVEEYPAEPVILLQPESVSILPPALLNAFRLLARARMRRPLSASVKQISQKEQGIRVQCLLKLFEGFS